MINNPFSAEASLRVFAIVVIGGMASVPGAILGAIYVFGMQYYMLPEWRFLATGIGLLAILLILPGGLGAGPGRGARRPAPLLARRHGILVPSLVADRRDDALPGHAGDGRGRRRGRRAARDRRSRGAGTVTDLATPVEASSDRDRRPLVTIGRHTVRRPRGPRRYFDDITAGYAALPAAHPVRPQRRRRARPHGLRGPRTGDPRLLRAHQPGLPHARRAHAARWAPPRGPARLLRRPAPPGPDRVDRRRGVGDVRPVHRPVDDDPHARDRPIGRRDGPRRGRRRPTTRCSPTTTRPRSAPTCSASTAWPTRSVPSSARWSAGSSPSTFGWRVPFFVFVIPSHRVRGARHAA